jgi:hypothetical protein
MVGDMSGNPKRLITGWFLVVAGAAAALLVVWLSRVVRVPLTTLLTAGAVILALSWLAVLTTVPWNLYFAARRTAQEIAVSVLTRESSYPRDDVATLLHRSDMMEQSADELRLQLRNANTDLRRTESALTDRIAHARQVLADDLNRLQDMQAADRAAARSRDEDLKRQIGQMVRRIEATLDGISDHQELLAGLRALVRMVRSDPA